jgi:hypothetical protein
MPSFSVSSGNDPTARRKKHLISGIDLVLVFRILNVFKGRFTGNENMESQLYQTPMRIINKNSQNHDEQFSQNERCDIPLKYIDNLQRSEQYYLNIYREFTVSRKNGSNSSTRSPWHSSPCADGNSATWRVTSEVASAKRH